MDAPSEKQSQHKRTEGDPSIFSPSSFTLLSRLLYLARSQRANKTHCLYHP